MLLAGDIGGTKTHLALYEKDLKKPLKEKKFASQDFSSLLEIISTFLNNNEKIEKACFGIAGPVKEGVCKTTNLPWTVGVDQIQKNLSIQPVALLNDLEANAWGIKVLSEEDLAYLHRGSNQKKSHSVLISAGTGLGEAGLFFYGQDHIPLACEGGHCDFAPKNEVEIELFRFLKHKFGHVSYERVLSGPGLVNIYEFFLSQKTEHPSFSIDIKDSLAAKVISEKGMKRECALCEKALDLFVSIYGAEAGNLALKYLAFGGVYVGGGIAPKILEKMQEGSFIKSFLDKGRFSSLLETISVQVILNSNTALMGSAYFSQNFL